MFQQWDRKLDRELGFTKCANLVEIIRKLHVVLITCYKVIPLSYLIYSVIYDKYLHFATPGAVIHVFSSASAASRLSLWLLVVPVGVVAEPVTALSLHTLGDSLASAVGHPRTGGTLRSDCAVVAVPVSGTANSTKQGGMGSIFTSFTKEVKG